MVRLVKYLLLLMIIIPTGIIIINSIRYDPMNMTDKKVLFKSYDEMRKLTYEDLIKFSINGEYAIIAKYRITNATINEEFPNSAKFWGNRPLDSNFMISGWKQTPTHNNDNKYIFDITNIQRVDSPSRIMKEINIRLKESGNYYCYILNKDEKHLILFEPNNNLMYYAKFNI